MQDKIDKIIEEQGAMKVDMAKIDGDIKSLRNAVLPMQKEVAVLERGYQKLEYGLAANDTKIETLKHDISKHLNIISEQLKAIPKLQRFERDLKIGARLLCFVVGLGFAFVAGISKVLLEMNAAIHMIAGK
ncbi:MAG: hypothetical protein KBC53_11770 [Nitrosomonas sp.]|nr:hypothetical protein [Nitrosomonas sp.]